MFHLSLLLVARAVGWRLPQGLEPRCAVKVLCVGEGHCKKGEGDWRRAAQEEVSPCGRVYKLALCTHSLLLLVPCGFLNEAVA